MYRPIGAFTTTLELLNPIYSKVKGVTTKKYEVVDSINCNFKTYGGSEGTINDTYSIIDTANIETWYRPDITSASRVRLGSKEYDVIGEPEDIEQRHMYIKFKVQAVRGGA